MEITKEQLKTLFDKHGVNCDITCSRFSGYVDDSFDSVFEAVQELVKNCDLADVVGRSEQYHCELFDFGRCEKPCDKQCDSCYWMENKKQ